MRHRATLGALCERGGGIQTGPFGSQLHASDYVTDGVPCVMPTNIGDNRIDENGIARVSYDDAERLSRYRLSAGDIVYSRRGDVEKRALVRAANDGWLCGTGCLRVRVGEGVDSRYVAYALGAVAAREWIVRHAVGATMLNLNTSILARLPLSVPTLGEQQAVAEVLGSIDDKIVANERVIDLMDEVTRQEFLALGGNQVRLSAIAINHRQQVDPADATPETVYVGLEHMPRRRMWSTQSGVASDVTSGKSKFEPKDVLFGKLRPYFHKVVAAPGHGICSTDIMVVRARDRAMAGYVMAATASDEAIRVTSAATEGTRMPRTNWKDLGAVQVPWPGRSAALNFSTAVDKRNDTAQSVVAQSLTLAHTRDALLPLLMSGKLRVADVTLAD